MPTITLSVRLVKITRTIEHGQWIMLYPDDRYDVLTPEQARGFQGQPTRTPPRPTKSSPTPQVATLTPPKSTTVNLNGKTLTVQPQKMALLQYMATHGDLTVADATTLLGGNTPTTVLSALKVLGFVDSRPLHATSDSPRPPHIYTLTNEGRAVAQGMPTNA